MRTTITYSALGRMLEVFSVDADTGALGLLQTLRMPALIQYGWFNAARTMLYLATSDSGPMARTKQPNHFVQALHILPDGCLDAHGDPVRLSNRPLYVTLDPAEAHLLLAYNNPPEVTVHRIAPDGLIGEQIAQPPLEFGTTVHQVRVTPPGTIALVPACGHDATGEIGGSLGIFAFCDGLLSPLGRMLPDPERAGAWRGVCHGAQGFAARHLTFHPTQPWMYLCVETQSELRLYDYDGQAVALEPRAICSTLEGLPPHRSAQMASAVHVHPNGRTIYISNRAWDTEEVDGQKVFVGGVNDIAVFAIDRDSGVPTLIQHIDTHGIFPRTFGLNAEGTLLVAGNEEPRLVEVDGRIERVVPSLVVYRIEEDGRLTFLTKRDHPDNGEICFWVGVISLPD